ncbi:MAG: UDP-N-acetylglucosamine diphosphorylase/glucosamine-1-phosphate N-acetyltransferase [Hydrogenophilales bacterium CG03_land_8_20_14_0_80_62_28]|nr:UDP-N-acetylglucosamine diphosphorylase/glucosamine-1-phosphate N-acetyltransferase [Betaproteobacteria bacterium]OIO77043.1 MAG: UDP-N-acetylglucosamine diphosphorylase/glucosamine-1-phosphate N-acetyltransferase [Hydrogenophilaceae bacterium CG1_02_62_390]PIV22626.1 MAG: UDP-N-acetylglucosamine diphosphorylase/glucosamine-1-phosphate N-acetyltransferase [Hydrogenophilales bacterium CG03_land_8_20_14_0_80_62_28]PIW38202.1 MAG: UDP-N-acetylglucosamine diphosphorylase/glucosamine-1-phosphate N
MNAPLTIVILAAGKGTRMNSDLPKVLHPLAGKPLISHVLAAADQLKPQRICVVYGHGGEALPVAIGGRDLTWVRQEPQLGTGHAVQQAMPYLDMTGICLILYGDVPLIRAETLRQMVLIAHQGALALLTVTLADPTGYGRIVRDGHGQVRRIVEHKDASPEQLAIREVNTGILCLPTIKLAGWLTRLGNDNAQGEYYLTDVIAMAAAEGERILPCHPASEWEVMGVNSRSQLAGLERYQQHHIAEALMAAGVTLIDPARLDVRGSLECGRDCLIDVNCVFEGRVVLSENVTVGANCVLKDVALGPGVEIKPFCHIDGAVIGAKAIIGPYARLRPGTELAEAAHIGNFVELKNTQVGFNSKINHLSYVGDATVGRKVNIGAGTITCNYDGANKYRTVIEDEAFIGSDSQLVAPVTVGKGATLGAGTTLTKDAPAGELTLSRARQMTIPGWKRPVKK